MLQIKDVRKKYVTGDLVQTALDGVSLNLRENEFVAILGPSGSGKTTLLNVIGGLDRYDSGDLIINGISTKKYTDRDWDSYRNHTIGFVFQSYNLIPHQTVLANVELALTISGVSRAERRRRATKALEDVGLGNQLHKRPNQMSGGQMQRVAIARALVNDPDILLADEPTGALDSETSVQVMELLKEVSRERLVVMVTHNPELAEEYANRIVRVKDGKIIGDTNPFAVDESVLEPARHKNMGRSSMSVFTAMALSFNNLRTKKARTLLTAFAGSIGIIGIALIMSLSTGFQKYIDKIQAETMSNYPLSIQSETANMASMFVSFGSTMRENHSKAEGTVSEQPMISQMFANIGTNDLRSFKAYLQEHDNEIGYTLNAVKYDYGVKPRIYLEDTSEIQQVNPATLMSKIMGNSFMSAYMDSDVFQEMIDNPELLQSQYDVLRGRWPADYREMVFVLSDPAVITDYIAYTLGLKDTDGLDKMMQQVMDGKEVTEELDMLEWSYDDLLALKFRLIPAADLYRYNAEYEVWEDMSSDEAFMRRLIADGEELSIVGIVTPKEGASATALSTGIAYSSELTRHVILAASEKEIVAKQQQDDTIDVFTGKGFNDKSDSSMNFEDMISVDGDAIAGAFGMDMDMDSVMRTVESYLRDALSSSAVDTSAAQRDFIEVLGDMARDIASEHIGSFADEEGVAKLYLADIQYLVDSYLASAKSDSRMAYLSGYSIDAPTLRQLYRPLLMTLYSGYSAQWLMDSVQPENPELPEESVEFQPNIPAMNPQEIYAELTWDRADSYITEFTQSDAVKGVAGAVSLKMMEKEIRSYITQKLQGLGYRLAGQLQGAFHVDTEMLQSAFQFNMDEAQIRRLMEAMSASGRERSARTNLQSLGYADLENPIELKIYMKDFEAKEDFVAFLNDYNQQMRDTDQEDRVLRYTDVTGMMMSSVRTIINSVSYALIAFVAVSLVVSSIMIGIITYISVMERTKEIGILRAIGASKRNISQVFNAETFIIGLISGLIGIGITLILLVPGNQIIHNLTDNPDITAQLPVINAVVLILLSVVLTFIGGLIPSRTAAKKDPVIALRTE